jgi:hypothetical protein
MTSANPSYESKLQELTHKVAEVERRATALSNLIQPGFDLRTFHTIYDPLMDSAKEAHDIYHELLQAAGYVHGEDWGHEQRGG